MFSPKKIKSQYGAMICRGCLNEIYKIHLVPGDCIYGYRRVCPLCNEMRNIVSGLRLTGKWKMLFK